MDIAYGVNQAMEETDFAVLRNAGVLVSSVLRSMSVSIKGFQASDAGPGTGSAMMITIEFTREELEAVTSGFTVAIGQEDRLIRSLKKALKRA